MLEKKLTASEKKANEALKIAQLNQTQIELLKKSVEAANSKTEAIKADIANISQQINKTLSQVETANNNTAQTNQQIADVKAQQQQLSNQLNQQAADINVAKEQLKTLEILQTAQRIKELQESGIIPLTKKVNLDAKIITFDQDIQTLKSGLEVSSKLTNDNITVLKQGLEVSNKLTNSQIKALNTNQQNIVNKIQTLETKIPELVQQNTNNNLDTTVNPEQYNQLNNKLDNLNNKINLINPYTISIAVGSLPILQQILNKPNPISPCQAPILVPPVAAQAKANGAATTTLQAVNTAQNAAIQNTVTQNRNLLTNAQYGLQATKNFLQTAWKATKGDKILNAITTGLILHNAIMLSLDIGQTIGDTASLALEVMGIRDENDKIIDVNDVIKSKLTALIQKILGEQNYKELTAKLQANIRVYQAGANILSNVRSLVDSTQDLAETTAENVSFIGNALKKDGVVRENSYNWMPTDYQHTSRILNKLDKISTNVNAIQEITSDTKEITEEISELKESRNEFKTEINKAYGDKEKDEKDKLDDVTNTPEPSESDEDNLAANE